MRTLRLLCLLSVLLTVVLKSFRAVATQTCDSDDPNVVLTKAAYYEPGDDELIKCYLDHRKLDIETSDADKRTAMHHACLHGNVEVVRLLVERNAALDDQDKYGYTPVMWAAKGGYVEIVSYLLQRNVVLDSQDIAGYNALMHAVLFDRTEAAIAIIEEMDVKDMDAQEEEYGHTALHLSAFYDRDVLSAVILLYGADPEVQDFEGKTAAQLARMNGNINVIKAMQDPEAYLKAKGYTGTDNQEL